MMNRLEKHRAQSLKWYHNNRNRMTPKELEAHKQKDRARQVSYRAEKRVMVHTKAEHDMMARVREELGINPIKPRLANPPYQYFSSDHDECPGSYVWDFE